MRESRGGWGVENSPYICNMSEIRTFEKVGLVFGAKNSCSHILDIKKCSFDIRQKFLLLLARPI